MKQYIVSYKYNGCCEDCLALLIKKNNFNNIPEMITSFLEEEKEIDVHALAITGIWSEEMEKVDERIFN